MRKKIAVIGAGFVGSTTAQRVLEKGLGDVVLLDMIEGMPQGKALDMLHSGAAENFTNNIIGANDYKDISGADVVVITAGLARKPGMSREDLLFANAKIVTDITLNIKKYAPDSFVIVVTNPMDIMAYVVWKKSGFSANKVLGMGGVLDTARFKSLLAMKLGVAVTDIQAMVLGGHGDEMVPLVDYTTVSGIPVKTLMSKKDLDEIVQRTRKSGAEIVELLKTGSAYYAPSSAAVYMAEAILLDKKRLLPASVLLNGEYGIKDAYVGVPIILGANGLEKIIEVDLSDLDLKQLQKSAEVIKKNISALY